MSEENTAGQQAEQPTAPQGGAGTSTPAQPVSQAQAPPETDWRARFTGLQPLYQDAVSQLKQTQALLNQQSQHQATLEQQLTQVQQERSGLNQTLEQAQAQLNQFQQETQFWNLVSSEYPDLFPLASVLQRVSDPEQQRQILQVARDRLGGQVQQQVTRQVAQNFAGVTPGASPMAQQPQNQLPTKEEVLTALDRHPVGSEEYRRWWAIWERHPERSPATLHPDWQDPLMSDWDRVRNVEEPNIVEDRTLTQGPWAAGGPTNPRS